VGESSKQLDKVMASNASSIQSRIGPAKNRAYGSGNRLFAELAKDRKPAAVDAHNRGMEKLHSADDQMAKIPKNAEDLDYVSYGELALQDYNAAMACFKEGLALFGA
jgi:hypothetical protein